MATEGKSYLSLAEARQKCQEKHSCFKQIELKEHMCLSPSYIGRLREGIDEELSKKVMKFCDKLQGVIVAYDRIQLVQRHGSLVEESPFLHFEVKVNYIVFQPQVDSKLVGVVNKFGYDHIGCLVHGCFNASITNNLTRTPNGHCTDNLMLGSSFTFRVVSLESLNGVLLISGAFDDKSLRKSKSKTPLRTPGDKTRCNGAETEGTSACTETQSSRKPTKHKKDKISDETNEFIPKKKRKLSNGDVNKIETLLNNNNFIGINSKPENSNNEENYISLKKTKKNHTM